MTINSIKSIGKNAIRIDELSPMFAQDFISGYTIAGCLTFNTNQPPKIADIKYVDYGIMDEDGNLGDGDNPDEPTGYTSFQVGKIILPNLAAVEQFLGYWGGCYSTIIAPVMTGLDVSGAIQKNDCFMEVAPGELIAKYAKYAMYDQHGNVIDMSEIGKSEGITESDLETYLTENDYLPYTSTKVTDYLSGWFEPIGGSPATVAKPLTDVVGSNYFDVLDARTLGGNESNDPRLAKTLKEYLSDTYVSKENAGGGGVKLYRHTLTCTLNNNTFQAEFINEVSTPYNYDEAYGQNGLAFGTYPLKYAENNFSVYGNIGYMCLYQDFTEGKTYVGVKIINPLGDDYWYEDRLQEVTDTVTEL